MPDNFKTEIQRFITQSNILIEKDMGLPYFTWAGTNYNFIPSVVEFDRELETGGYSLVKLLMGTVRRLDWNGNTIFTTLPTAQQKITYNVDGLQYRIISIHTDPTQSYFRIKAENTNRGI